MFWTSDKHQEFNNSKICSVHKKKQMDEFGVFQIICAHQEMEKSPQKIRNQKLPKMTDYI